MLNINTEVVESGKGRGLRPLKTRSLKRYLLEKVQAWINTLLEAERDEFLGRGRYELLDEEYDNYRNGYRPRRINLFGLGELELRMPRDRKGEFESGLLPERKGQGQDPELEAFLAGLSTRDLERISSPTRVVRCGYQRNPRLYEAHVWFGLRVSFRAEAIAGAGNLVRHEHRLKIEPYPLRGTRLRYVQSWTP